MNFLISFQSYSSVDSTSSTTDSWRSKPSSSRGVEVGRHLDETEGDLRGQGGSERYSTLSRESSLKTVMSGALSTESLVLTENISLNSRRRTFSSSEDSDQEVSGVK